MVIENLNEMEVLFLCTAGLLQALAKSQLDFINLLSGRSRILVTSIFQLVEVWT